MSRSQRIAVVLNGNAKSVSSKVVEQVRGFVPAEDLFVSHQLTEAPQIAEDLVRGEYDAVLTGGGDGTFTVTASTVLHACRRLERPLPRLGLLKLGTGNALAEVVKPFPLEQLTSAEALQQVCAEASRKSLRFVEVDSYLTPFAGVGADALILADYNVTKNFLQKTPLRPFAAGLFGYGVSSVTRSLPAFLWRTVPTFRVVSLGRAQKLDAQGAPLGPDLPAGSLLFEGKARIAGVSTIPYYGFRFKMFPFADGREDRMHLRIGNMGSLGFVWNVRDIWQGRYRSDKVFTDFWVEGVEFQSDPPADLQIGGDPQGKRERVQAQISPLALPLLSHQDTPSQDSGPAEA